MKATREYLSATQAAEYLGISRVQFYRRQPPEPDAKIGTICGWTQKTLDEWTMQLKIDDQNTVRTGPARRFK